MDQDSAFVVVAAVDFSETGDLALAHALRVAGNAPGGELHAVHVLTEQDLARAEGASRLEKTDDAVAHIPMKLWDRVYQIGSSLPGGLPRMRVSVHVRVGMPAEAIHQVAVDYNADLIVAGTHGRRGLRKLVLGSVAEALLRNARVPVTVVRPRDYEGIPRTERVEPPHPPGESLPGERHFTHVYGSTQVVSWTRPPADAEGVRLY